MNVLAIGLQREKNVLDFLEAAVFTPKTHMGGMYSAYRDSRGEGVKNRPSEASHGKFHRAVLRGVTDIPPTPCQTTV